MTKTLTESSAVRYYDDTAGAGSDKRYPTINLVRLEHRHFEHKPGRLLEYAFGTGCNLIHLLECGHTIDALDTSENAARVVAAKLDKRPDIKERATLHVLKDGADRLSFDDETFDYVNCMSVLSLLGSPQRIDLLLAELKRVLKPSGKIIADINGPESVFSTFGEHSGNDIYMFGGNSESGVTFPCYCPAKQEPFVELMAQYFTVDDVGFTAHRIYDFVEQEFIVCAHKE
jgi:ubiquinone/menaquinone biosynthesis C-methylase UbiE